MPIASLRPLTITALVASVPLAAPAPAAAQSLQPAPLAYETHTLDNGLQLVVARDGSRPIVNVQVWYHVGSKDEKPGRTGFAHLFEHMMFRGSRNVGPEEHMRYVREAGGTLNAYTSFDQTVYWQTVPSNHLERMLWLEADRMASLVVNEANFVKEREVVKEERRLRYENAPYGLVAEQLIDLAFETYPYTHIPIGSMDDLNAATAADVKEFFDTFYVPDNATVVVVGDVDPAQALAWTRKYFAPIPKSRTPVPRVTATEPPQKALREATRAWSNAPLPAVFRAWKFPPRGHPDAYALSIAADILSTGESSRLYRTLVYDKQIAVQAAGQTLLLEGPSLFFGILIAAPGKTPQELTAGFDEVLDGMRKAAVTPAELDKAKNTVIARLVIGRQSMQDKADALGLATVLLGDPARYNTELQSYQKVTADDVRRVVQTYLTTTAETRLVATPEGR